MADDFTGDGITNNNFTENSMPRSGLEEEASRKSKTNLKEGERKEMDIKYPTRCKIIDVGNKSWMKTPNVSKPHIGKYGLAEEIDGLVKITLDDSHVIWGHECWWIPVEEKEAKQDYPVSEE